MNTGQGRFFVPVRVAKGPRPMAALTLHELWGTRAFHRSSQTSLIPIIALGDPFGGRICIAGRLPSR